MALSKHGVAQTAAAKITRRNPEKYAEEFVAWMDSKTHATAAMDSLNAASDLSKHPRIILALAEQFYQTLDDYPEESALPDGGEPGQVVGVGPDGERGWVELPAATSTFRGDWAAGNLAKIESFAGGTIPAEYVQLLNPVGNANVSIAVVQTSTIGLPNAPAAVSCANLLAAHDYAVEARLTLDLATLNLPNLSSMSFWWGLNQDIDRFDAEVLKNGSSFIRETPMDFGWKKVTMPVGPTDVIAWHHVRTYSGNDWAQARIGLTQIEFYETAEPYMTGEFVTHKGKMWKSLVDNNGLEPGAGNWSETLDLPSKSGATAQRPTPATVGTGYPFFDTTLNKPIWVNTAATGWVDATGTAVV